MTSTPASSPVCQSSSPSRPRWLVRRVALVVVGAAVISSPACLATEELGTTDFSCPSPDGFRVVSQVLERRCGTMDCHGDESRTFRIYGRTGMRLPRTEAEYVAERQSTSAAVSVVSSSDASVGSGGGGDQTSSTGGGEGGASIFDEYVTGGTEATSNAEVEANRLSACGIEPDLMSEVVNTNGDPSTLTLVRKPRLTEAHKGGLIWEADSLQGDKCLTTWIDGLVDVASCNGELKRP